MSRITRYLIKNNLNCYSRLVIRKLWHHLNNENWNAKDNFESWPIQMKTLSIKNYAWVYASGSKPKPATDEDNAKSKDHFDKWIEIDEKDKEDISLCISPSKLKQIKNYETSSYIWKKLEEIYQLKSPACKASLLKPLISIKYQILLPITVFKIICIKFLT